MDTRELTFVQFEVRNPLTFPLEVPGRVFRDVIGLVEGLSMVGQTSVPEALTRRVKKFGEFTDDGILWGAYGARLHGQIGDLVLRLKGDWETRQAVLTIFDGGRDLAAAKRDVPCTISIHFLVRPGRDTEGQLDMRVTMRSNDMWLGTPYDMVQFSILQATIAQAIGIPIGRYVHAVGSLHVYERDIDAARNLRPGILGEMTGFGEMTFPLWGGDTNHLADLTVRARELMLSRHFQPETDFERWAAELLS